MCSNLNDTYSPHKRMNLLFLLGLLLISAAGFAQEADIKVGEIEFYGYHGVDTGSLRKSLPFREGDPISRTTATEKFKQARQTVFASTGMQPTDLASVCCDDRNQLIIYIGLSGKPIRYLPRPTQKLNLPGNAIKLYDDMIVAIDTSTRRGAVNEDWSNGYALSTSYPPLRAIQLKMHAYAMRHEGLITNVLENSSDDRQRSIAAELLGYAAQSTHQVEALAKASRDSSGEVRNNATRALGVIVGAKRDMARNIPLQNFVDMLLSGTWTDINKASLLLGNLTRLRDPALLSQLRTPPVLERLEEMAHWRTNHSGFSIIVLGRIAGLDEALLQQLAATHNIEPILTALHTRP